MLFFCEECGEKNIVEVSAVESNVVVFSCRACRHRNGYSMSRGETDEPAQRLSPVEKEERSRSAAQKNCE